jgi:hypothetical protein
MHHLTAAHVKPNNWPLCSGFTWPVANINLILVFFVSSNFPENTYPLDLIKRISALRRTAANAVKRWAVALLPSRQTRARDRFKG